MVCIVQPYTPYIENMATVKLSKPTKPKPKPGTLPLERDEFIGPPHPAQYEVPSFIPAEELDEPPTPKGRTPRPILEKLKAARRKADELRLAVRDDAFDEWVRRYLVAAEVPKDWTQAAVLYANYLERASTYGTHRVDRSIVKLELATETRFGILLRDAGFTKNRRSKGWYYPVKLKQGA
jgi:hypothetical protein